MEFSPTSEGPSQTPGKLKSSLSRTAKDELSSYLDALAASPARIRFSGLQGTGITAEAEGNPQAPAGTGVRSRSSDAVAAGSSRLTHETIRPAIAPLGRRQQAGGLGAEQLRVDTQFQPAGRAAVAQPAPRAAAPFSSFDSTRASSSGMGGGVGAGRSSISTGAGTASFSTSSLQPMTLPQAPVASSAAASSSDDSEALAAANTRVAQLSHKVQQQAKELSDMTVRLEQSDSVIHRLERRLLELCPSHPLPVVDEHMGLPPASLSRLCWAAATSLLGSFSSGHTAPPPVQGMGGAGGAAGSSAGAGATLGSGPLVSKAAQLLAAATGAAAGPAGGPSASTAAGFKKEALDASETIKRLEKSVRGDGEVRRGGG